MPKRGYDSLVFSLSYLLSLLCWIGDCIKIIVAFVLLQNVPVSTQSSSSRTPMLLSVLSILFALTTRLAFASRSPIELTIFKLSTGKCAFVSRRSVQTHRGLEHSPFVVEEHRLVFTPGGESNDGDDLRLRLYFYEENESIAYSQLASRCGEHFAPTNRELRFRTATAVIDQLDDIPFASGPKEEVAPPPLMIKPLFISGPSENRVDLVFFSDGCKFFLDLVLRAPTPTTRAFVSPLDTTEESDKFFGDARRLAQDMSQNQTFAPVSPLQNYWAAFSPSTESGIGTGGKPRK